MDAIIFDCDGTLVDSEVLVNEVLVEVVAEHGLVMALDEAVSSFRGGKLADCVAEIERRLGRSLPGDFVRSFGRAWLLRFASACERSMVPWSWCSH